MAHFGVRNVLYMVTCRRPYNTALRRALGVGFLCKVMNHGRPSVPNILRLIFRNKSPVYPRLPICPICSEFVALESSKADENGKAIHEECYLLKIGLKAATTPVHPLRMR